MPGRRQLPDPDDQRARRPQCGHKRLGWLHDAVIGGDVEAGPAQRAAGRAEDVLRVDHHHRDLCRRGQRRGQ